MKTSVAAIAVAANERERLRASDGDADDMCGAAFARAKKNFPKVK